MKPNQRMRNILIAIFLAMVCNPSNTAGQEQSGDNHYIYFVLDNSGSMKKNDPDRAIKEVVSKMIDSLSSGFHVGIILFSEDVSVRMHPAKLDETSISSVNELLQGISYQGAFTNIPDAVERAIYDLKQVTTDNASKSIILLTDGFVDLKDKHQNEPKRQWLLNSLAPDAKDAGIKIFGIAFTEQSDFELIQGIAQTTNGEYYKVFEASEVSGTLASIREKLSEPLQPPARDTVKVEIPVIVETSSSGKTNSVMYLIAALSLIILAFLLYGFFASKKKKNAGMKEVPSGKAADNIVIPPATLLDLDKSTEKGEYTLVKEVTSFGRLPQNDIVLPDDSTVTRYNHAQIIYKDNQFYIKDLSVNFTKRNDVQIDKKVLVELQDGDIISIMNNRFQFSLPSENKTTLVGGGGSADEDDGDKTVIVPPSLDDFNLLTGKSGDPDRSAGDGEQKDN